jgi:aminopeptidase YwaD
MRKDAVSSGNPGEDRIREYLEQLTVTIPERSVGSSGNRAATAFFRDRLERCGWKTECHAFAAIDWHDGGAELIVDDESYAVRVSPYAPGFDGTGVLRSAVSAEELAALDARDTILLVHGELAREQLMPKNFVFYNPEEHQRIVSLLEQCGAKAIVCATGRNPSLAGGLYPFPLIEDGDFSVPSVYMTEEEGLRLREHNGANTALRSRSLRIPGSGWNVSGCIGNKTGKRIVITAHIDAKKGTPGAMDNASGVAVLLLLAELLRGYEGPNRIELVALNGEDYFAVPGQMLFLDQNRDRFGEMLLNINIDGAGYHEGDTAVSFFDISEEIHERMMRVMKQCSGMTEGLPWPQSDHSMFVQNGVPAIAVTSAWFLENMETQDVTHTERDTLDLLDPGRIADIAFALRDFVLLS